MASLRNKTTDDFLLLIDLCKDPRQVFPVGSFESKMAMLWFKNLCGQRIRNLKEAQIRNTYVSLLVASFNMGCMIEPFLKCPPKGKLKKLVNNFDNNVPDSVLEQLSFWELALKRAVEQNECAGDQTPISTCLNSENRGNCGRCQYDHFSRTCHYSQEVPSMKWSNLQSALTPSISKLMFNHDCIPDEKDNIDCSGLNVREPLNVNICPNSCEESGEYTSKGVICDPCLKFKKSSQKSECTCTRCGKKKKGLPSNSLTPCTLKLPVVSCCGCSKSTQTPAFAKSNKSCTQRRTAVPVWKTCTVKSTEHKHSTSNKQRTSSKRPSVPISRTIAKSSQNSISRMSRAKLKKALSTSKKKLDARECCICENDTCPLLKKIRKSRRKKSGCKCKRNECEEGVPDFLSPPIQIKNLYPDDKSIPIYFDNCNPSCCSNRICCSSNCCKNCNGICTGNAKCYKTVCYKY